LASRGAQHAIYGIGLFSALINVLALTGSLFMLQVYDRVLPSHSVPTLVALAILTATLFTFYGLLDLFRGRMLVRLGAWLDAAISPQVYQAIVRLPLARIPNNKAEPLRDLDTVRSFLSGQGPCVLFDLPWAPIYLGFIYLFHPLLTLLALAGMLVLILLMLVTDLFTKGPIRAASGHAAERQHLAESSRRNAEALTALGMVGRYGEHWAKANDLYIASQQRASDLAGGLGALSRALRLMLQVGGSGFGGLSCHSAGSHRRHHHCQYHPDWARFGSSRSGDTQLEELDGCSAELAAAQASAPSRIRQRHADAPKEPR
jgi:ATP-binding cassette subfamily C protein